MTGKRCFFILISFFLMVTFSSVVMAVPSPPVMSVIVSDIRVTITWSEVGGATGYFFSYAPSPYTGPGSIITVDMGTANMLSAVLSPGDAFYSAVQAQDASGLSVFSNIEEIKIAEQRKKDYFLTRILV